MLKNYLSILLRGFRKTPVYSVLNITGLALGIACAALIFLWVEDEFSFDHEYAKRKQIYGVLMNIDYSNKIETYTTLPGPMEESIRPSIPEVVNATRMGFDSELFSLSDKASYQHGICVDTGFFSIMQPEFIEGNATGFTNIHSLVITAKMAKQFFGSADPLGKTLRVDNTRDFTVIGVVKDPSQNVSLSYDWLMPVQNFMDKNAWLKSWGTYGISTTVELRPDADIAKVGEKLTHLLRPQAKLYTHASCWLQPSSDWHLHWQFSNGKADGGPTAFVRLMLAIAWILILIACINFMNLATARAGQRAREVGVRKTLGALRNSLIGQFILEAILTSVIAVLLAVFLVYLSLPAFNSLVGKQLAFNPLQPTHLAALVTIALFCGLIAGSYPAFYLSSFQPVAVLKGQRIRSGTGAGFIRKGLVVTQFTVSVILIVCTVVIYQQVHFLRARDLGYDKEHLLYLPAHGDLVKNFNAIKPQLMETNVVANAALSGSPPLSMWSTITSQEITWQGAGANKDVRIWWEGVTSGYISTMGLQIQQGRNFYPEAKRDSGNVIINETMAALMGKEAHLGAQLLYGNRERYTIIGIVKDFLFNDMHASSISPLMISCEEPRPNTFAFMEIKLKAGNNLPAALAKVEAVVKAGNPGYPFDYSFVDQDFEHIFTTETNIGRFSSVFSLLAIFISCLGLFGLAAYTAERRTKEIGIRKVLGASTAGLATLLSKEFLQLVTLSCVIAFPLAWWFMTSWLKDYAYRTAIHWWVFGLAAVAAMFIALLTVSFLAIRAALANPVNSLRTE